MMAAAHVVASRQQESLIGCRMEATRDRSLDPADSSAYALKINRWTV